MRVVDMLDFVRERGGMLLADCFAIALRELGCIRQRRRVRGVECAELALRGLAVGECGGVFLLLAAMGRVDDWNDGRREQPRDGEQRHDDGERRVAALVWRGAVGAISSLVNPVSKKSRLLSCCVLVRSEELSVMLPPVFSHDIPLLDFNDMPTACRISRCSQEIG